MNIQDIHSTGIARKHVGQLALLLVSRKDASGQPEALRGDIDDSSKDGRRRTKKTIFWHYIKLALMCNFRKVSVMTKF